MAGGEEGELLPGGRGDVFDNVAGGHADETDAYGPPGPDQVDLVRRGPDGGGEVGLAGTEDADGQAQGDVTAPGQGQEGNQPLGLRHRWRAEDLEIEMNVDQVSLFTRFP